MPNPQEAPGVGPSGEAAVGLRVPSPAGGTLQVSLCGTGCSAMIHMSPSSLSSDLFTSIAAVWGSCSPRAPSYGAGMML